MEFLIDSNVLLDVLTDDPAWGEWSGARLAECADRGVLVINPIVFAEVSVGFQRIEELEEALPPRAFRRVPLPWEGAFLAGKAFLSYRRNRGQRSTPLPDFYIGAHAAVAGLTLVTRDPGRYRTYFPKLNLIAPPASAARR
jgi:predicted nucleic acid-binding protein